MRVGLLLIIPMPVLHADVEVHLGFDTGTLFINKETGKFLDYRLAIYKLSIYLFVSANLAFGNFFLSDFIRAVPNGLSFANSIKIGAATKIEE